MAEEIKYRPELKIKLSIVDYLLEASAIIILIFTWYYVISNYSTLPEKIPHHFNAMGEADQWGKKSIIWLMPIIGSVLWMLLSILSQYPQSFNYYQKINEHNVEYQYRLALRLMRGIKIIVGIIFLYVVHSMKMVALDQQNSSKINIFVILISLAITIITYLYLASKKR